jgi:hypothetical protein
MAFFSIILERLADRAPLSCSCLTVSKRGGCYNCRVIQLGVGCHAFGAVPRRVGSPVTNRPRKHAALRKQVVNCRGRHAFGACLSGAPGDACDCPESMAPAMLAWSCNTVPMKLGCYNCRLIQLGVGCHAFEACLSGAPGDACDCPESMVLATLACSCLTVPMKRGCYNCRLIQLARIAEFVGGCLAAW